MSHDKAGKVSERSLLEIITSGFLPCIMTSDWHCEMVANHLWWDRVTAHECRVASWIGSPRLILLRKTIRLPSIPTSIREKTLQKRYVPNKLLHIFLLIESPYGCDSQLYGPCSLFVKKAPPGVMMSKNEPLCSDVPSAFGFCPNIRPLFRQFCQLVRALSTKLVTKKKRRIYRNSACPSARRADSQPVTSRLAHHWRQLCNFEGKMCALFRSFTS